MNIHNRWLQKQFQHWSLHGGRERWKQRKSAQNYCQGWDTESWDDSGFDKTLFVPQSTNYRPGMGTSNK